MEASDPDSSNIIALKKQLYEKDCEIEQLKRQLQQYQDSTYDTNSLRPEVEVSLLPPIKLVSSLTKTDIERYSRQLILPEFGVKGQKNLQSTSVLIVGAGGLGCPAAVYLAAAGIGRLGVVDYDEVELSNLHRQILHTSDRVGLSKSLSIVRSCHRLNSSVEYVPYQLQLSSENALAIISKYDIVLDATDNVATRYLLNDACVFARKPLVSGSALRFEGQLTVYNCCGGPCYRCLFPQPPPPESVTNCSEGGVIGVVPGIIGSMQALEAIKIGSGMGTSYSQRLLLFDALDGTFRSVQLRPRSSACVVCGDQPSIRELVDYVQFCGAAATDKIPLARVMLLSHIVCFLCHTIHSGSHIGNMSYLHLLQDQEVNILDKQSRISAKEYHAMLSRDLEHILLDVRPEVERDICQLPHPSINIPYTTFTKDVPKAALQIIQKLKDLRHQQGAQSYLSQMLEGDLSDQDSSNTSSLATPPAIVCVCRRGNDSQFVVRKLQQELQSGLLEGGPGAEDHSTGIRIVDIRGGLHGWARHVDHQFPVY